MFLGGIYKTLSLGCTHRFKKIFKTSLVLTIFIFLLISPSLIGTNNDLSVFIVEMIGDRENVALNEPVYFKIKIVENQPPEGIPVVDDKLDVFIKYQITSISDSKIILSEEETKAVELGDIGISYIKRFDLLKTLDEGEYNLKIDVSVGSHYADDSLSFKIIKVSEMGQTLLIIILIIGLVITVIALIYEHKKVQKLKVSNKDFDKYVKGDKK